MMVNQNEMVFEETSPATKSLPLSRLMRGCPLPLGEAE
jgi:hypothetical protein